MPLLENLNKRMNNADIGIIAIANKGNARIIRTIDITTNPPILKNWSEKKGRRVSAEKVKISFKMSNLSKISHKNYRKAVKNIIK